MLPEKRMLEIARAKVAFAEEMKHGPRLRRTFTAAPTTEWLAMPLPRSKAVAAETGQSVIDRLEDEAYARDPTLFWLWPERWEVPLRRETQRPDWFWMHIPTPEILAEIERLSR